MIDPQHGALITTVDSMPVAIMLLGTDDLRRVAWRRFLQQPGCSLLIAPGIPEGLDAARKQRVDMIVADVNDPVKDGVAFFEQVRPLCRGAVHILAVPADVKEGIYEALSRGLVDQAVALPWNEEEVQGLLLQTIRLQRDLRVQKVRAELQSFRNIPAPSRFFSRLQELLAKSDVSIQQLAREIEQNPSFVARTLQVANSVHFWTRASITSVTEALNLIGTQYISTLILGIEMFETVMRDAPPAARGRYEEIWKHALGRSIIARQIAQSSQKVVDPGHAHVASLLQDIGLMLRLCGDPDRYLLMEATASIKAMALYDAEWQVFGMTHDHLGAALLELWNFPPPVIVAVANQHGETFGDALTSIIQVADCLTAHDPCLCHDSSLDPLVEFWRERLQVFLVGINESKKAQSA